MAHLLLAEMYVVHFVGCRIEVSQSPFTKEGRHSIFFLHFALGHSSPSWSMVSFAPTSFLMKLYVCKLLLNVSDVYNKCFNFRKHEGRKEIEVWCGWMIVVSGRFLDE
jgi:hypothetical protein